MKLYIAGPVTGIPNDNKDAFTSALRRLIVAGYCPSVPHLVVPSGASWEEAMKLSVALMMQADGVALLNGWQTSRGARIEYDLARDLGMPAYGVEHWLTNAKHYLKGGGR